MKTSFFQLPTDRRCSVFGLAKNDPRTLTITLCGWASTSISRFGRLLVPSAIIALSVLTVPTNLAAQQTDPSPSSQAVTNIIPPNTLKVFINKCRNDLEEMKRKIRKQTTSTEKIWRAYKQGQTSIPAKYGSGGEDVLQVQGQKAMKYFFRNAEVKQKAVDFEFARLQRLKKLKTLLSNLNGDEALSAILRLAGPSLASKNKGTIGFLSDAKVIQVVDDKKVIVSFKNTDFMLNAESTNDLSPGQFVAPSLVYVSGTQSFDIPDSDKSSLPVLHRITDERLRSTIFGAEKFRTWTDKTGKHKIEAELIKNDGTLVHLKKRDGSVIKVPLSKLDKASAAAAGN